MIKHDDKVILCEKVFTFCKFTLLLKKIRIIKIADSQRNSVNKFVISYKIIISSLPKISRSIGEISFISIKNLNKLTI